jgi:hypothetical protein
MKLPKKKKKKKKEKKKKKKMQGKNHIADHICADGEKYYCFVLEKLKKKKERINK